MSRSSLALVNLRAVAILIVPALHSVLPYLASLPPTPRLATECDHMRHTPIHED